MFHCEASKPARTPHSPARAPWHWLGTIALLACLFIGTMGGAAWARTYTAIVMNAHNGQVLYASDADRRVYPASLTKMMTLYLLFEALESGKVSMDTRMRVSRHAAGQSPSKLGLAVGSTITVGEAIPALAIKSANDVAAVVAEHLGKTESQFAQMMTRKARDLGMSRTTFRNASGLPNNGQLSTARDMATLSLALMGNFPQYYHYFGERSFVFRGKTYTTHNRVVLNYDGADGLKTGYIRASGFNLAASARRNGVRLVAVVFGGRTSRSRDQHMMDLLDRGFSSASAVASAEVPQPLPKPEMDVALTSSSAAPVRPIPQGSTAALPGTMVPVIPLSKPQSLAGVETPAQPQDVAATAPARPGEVPLNPGLKQSWGVQVGAFSQIETAQKQADLAADLLRRARLGAQPAVTAVPSGRSLIYRSRVLGLSNEDAARKACDRLRDQRIHCVIVRPGSMDVAFLPSPGSASFNVQ